MFGNNRPITCLECGIQQSLSVLRPSSLRSSFILHGRDRNLRSFQNLSLMLPEPSPGTESLPSPVLSACTRMVTLASTPTSPQPVSTSMTFTLQPPGTADSFLHITPGLGPSDLWLLVRPSVHLSQGTSPIPSGLNQLNMCVRLLCKWRWPAGSQSPGKQGSGRESGSKCKARGIDGVRQEEEEQRAGVEPRKAPIVPSAPTSS